MFDTFLANPTVISAFEPATTNPALITTLESYIKSIYYDDLSSIPHSPPAFVTALPTDAQILVSEAWSQVDSIFSVVAKAGTSTISSDSNTGGVTSAPASTLLSGNSNFATSAFTSSGPIPTGSATRHDQFVTTKVVIVFLVSIAVALST